MDYYQTLGVPNGASPDEIKKAYRSLAMKHHPDRGGNADEFKKIQEAYDTLGDEQKKAEYDNPYPSNGGGFGNVPPGFEHVFSHFGFNEFFRPPRPRNRDLNFHTKISLEDAFNGKELVVNFFKANGKEKILNVKVPAGIQSGMTLRLQGVGDDSLPSAQAGDVFVVIEILTHSEFRRQGDDLIKTIEISCIDAMLGKDINITTLDGKTLNGSIPAGTQPDSVLSIPNQGMPNINNNASRGRLLLEIKMSIPKLNDIQKSTIRSLFP